MTKLADDQVMALPRKLVEHALLGLYDPINSHLTKLVGFEFSPELRQHFRRELRAWFRKIQTLRMKPHHRTGSTKFYFDLLFEYPFGGVELRNMRMILDEIAEDYPDVRAAQTSDEMVAWLRDFHARLAERLHNGEDVLDMIPE